MIDYMYKAKNRDAWVVFAQSRGVLDDEGRLLQPYAVDELGEQGDAEFPFLVNIRVLADVLKPAQRALAEISEDCVWVDPTSLSNPPLRVFGGGMQYYAPEPIPMPTKRKGKKNA